MTDDRSPPVALVVDDDPGVLAYLSEVLAGAGWRVETESRGDCTLARVASLRPDLVLLDVLMPGVDGFSVLTHIRSDGDLDGVRVVLVSGEPVEVHGAVAEALGADGFLEKPVSPTALLRVLADACPSAVA